MITIGIDPGAAGGIAVWNNGVSKVLKIPKDLSTLQPFFEFYAQMGAIVFLEKLSVRHDDTEGGKIWRIQKMLAQYERLKAMMEVAHLPYCMVHPMTWQTRLGLRLHGQKEPRESRKVRYKIIAEKWYPNTRVTMWNADALLIMRFGLWVQQADKKWLQANLPKAAKEIFDK